MGSSKYVAVYWNKKTKKWVAYITHNKESICIGYFKNEKNAANAVNWKCRKLNIPIKNPEVGVLDNEPME
jgi:hypothetical protein